MSFVLKVSFILLCVSLSDAIGFRCLDCQRLPLPRDCDHVSTCGDHEVCHVTQYVSRSGNVFYDSGCIDKMICNNKRDVNDSITYTDADEEAGDITVCQHCCDGDFCNVQGCGSIPLPPLPERGPICFSCPYGSLLPEQCERIAGCSKDEQCSIEPFVSVGGDNLYRSSCRTCIVSETMVVGKRETCSGCCTTDYCNRNCSMVLSQSASPERSQTTVPSPAQTTVQTSGTEQKCRIQNYKYLRAYNHCVKVYSNISLNWHDARSRCKEDGGDLLVLHNKQEQDYFEELLTDISGHSVVYWVGASDLDHEGKWIWTDGIPVASTYFFPNEPNNNGISNMPENCGALSYFTTERSTLLNDAACGIQSDFICEMNIANRCPDSSYTYTSHFNLCYKIYNDSLTWDEARNQCLADNAVLLEPETREEIDYFDNILRKTNAVYYWVGARQKSGQPSVFVWQTSLQPVAANLWHDGEPSSISEGCASIYWYNREPLDHLFLLNDVPCNTHKRYICQYMHKQ